MSVFHWDAATETWVRERTTLDWPNRQLIATVNRFSFVTVGMTCIVNTPSPFKYKLCYTDGGVGGTSVIRLDEFTGMDTLKVSDSGGTVQFAATGGSGTLTTARARMTSLIINAGTSNVEINGNLDSLGGTLEIDESAIKVDSGFSVSANGAVNFNAIFQSNGTSVFGITTTLLGRHASIELDGAAVSGTSVDLEAMAGTLTTTVTPGGDSLGVGTLRVASTYGFKDTGTFSVDGGSGPCTYGSKTDTSFTTVSGCTGTPVNGAVLTTGIAETGSCTGINHAGLQLLYEGTINVHGASTITATGGDVKLASVANVLASANAAGGADLGAWSSGFPYTKGDIVTFNTKRYAALNNVTSPNNPASDTTNWKDAKASDSSVTGAQVLANAVSQLSGTSAITATGNVSITSNVKTNISSKADSTGAGSGAGIAVAVLPTDSEAFVDSAAATPITSTNLTLSADHTTTAPTHPKAT